jgi:hypothetical protein
LYGFHIYVDSVVVPCIGSESIGYDRRKDSVEIEEEEDGEDTAQGHKDEEFAIGLLQSDVNQK